MATILILFLISFASVHAEDLGTFGATFQIKEDDLMLVLQKRLADAKLDDKQNQQIKEAFVSAVKKPKGIKLPKAKSARHFEFDPTLCVHEDITDLEQVIVAKGTKVNPLESVSLSEDLLFFDGSDSKQVTWAKKHPGIWILTDGNPLQLEESEKRAVYFDQAGYLTSRIGIKALPAKVSQNSKMLKVEEMPCL